MVTNHISLKKQRFREDKLLSIVNVIGLIKSLLKSSHHLIMPSIVTIYNIITDFTEINSDERV